MSKNRNRKNESNESTVEMERVDIDTSEQVTDPEQANEPSIEHVEVKAEQSAPTEQLIQTEQVKEEPDPFYVPESKKSEEEVKSEEFIAKARSYTTQSARVRFLTSQGLTRGQIVKIYPQLYGRTILYQHVRNILVTPVSTTQ